MPSPSPTVRVERRFTMAPVLVERLLTTATAIYPKKYQLLTYRYTADILEKRGPFREAHLAAAHKQVDLGNMLLAGAFDGPVDGAAFVWTPAADRPTIDAFVKDDPYVKAGLVLSHDVRVWNVMVD